MSDTLLAHARNAFEHSDWAALVQDIREFLARDKGSPSAPKHQRNEEKAGQ